MGLLFIFILIIVLRHSGELDMQQIEELEGKVEILTGLISKKVIKNVWLN